MSAVKNIFAPKSSRVLRVLLVDFGRVWDERELFPTEVREDVLGYNSHTRYLYNNL